jgi:hypothetical protein
VGDVAVVKSDHDHKSIAKAFLFDANNHAYASTNVIKGFIY